MCCKPMCRGKNHVMLHYRIHFMWVSLAVMWLVPSLTLPWTTWSQILLPQIQALSPFYWLGYWVLGLPHHLTCLLTIWMATRSGRVVRVRVSYPNPNPSPNPNHNPNLFADNLDGYQEQEGSILAEELSEGCPLHRGRFWGRRGLVQGGRASRWGSPTQECQAKVG